MQQRANFPQHFDSPFPFQLLQNMTLFIVWNVFHNILRTTVHFARPHIHVTNTSPRAPYYLTELHSNTVFVTRIGLSPPVCIPEYLIATKHPTLYRYQQMQPIFIYYTLHGLLAQKKMRSHLNNFEPAIIHLQPSPTNPCTQMGLFVYWNLGIVILSTVLSQEIFPYSQACFRSFSGKSNQDEPSYIINMANWKILTVDVINIVYTNLRIICSFPSPWQFIPNTIRKWQGLC